MSLYYPQSFGEIEIIRHWVNDQLEDTVDNPGIFTVAVLDKDEPNKILAGAIFSNHSKNNIFLSGAISREGIGKVTKECLSDMLWVAFRKPFNCLRITALVSETNKRSQRFMEGLGFTKEGELRDYLEGGKNTFVYGLTKSDYLGGAYGWRQRRRREATGLRAAN